MIENQQIWAALESLITFKGAIRAVEIRECCPAGAGRGTQWNRDAGDFKPVGQEFPTVENLATTCGDHSIAALQDEIVLDPLKVQLTTIMFKILLKNLQTHGLEISADPGSERVCGLTPSEQQWIGEEL